VIFFTYSYSYLESEPVYVLNLSKASMDLCFTSVLAESLYEDAIFLQNSRLEGMCHKINIF
jgi:hypothetical protein